MKLFHIRNLFLNPLALLVAATCAVSGQVVRQAVSISAEIGPGMYFGEFNSLDYQNTFSPSTGYDEGLNVTYNPSRNFTIGLGVGRMRLVYDVYDVIRARYQASFFGPIGTPTYPGSPVAITPQNNIDVTKYILFARTNFQPMNSLVPYFTIGLGLMSFNATNGAGEDLPTNITGTYSHKALLVPLGGGLEYYINEDFSLHLQGLIYLTSSDYVDGYAHYLDYETPNPPLPGPGQQETPSDYMGSIMLGASYVVYRPEEE
jgi:opacity protein-like surface antigen